MNAELELRLYRLLHDLAARGRDATYVHRTVRWYLREAWRFFGADHGCVAVLAQDRQAVKIRHAVGTGEVAASEVLGAVLRDAPSSPPPTMIVAPVQRRKRLWGVLALTRRSAFAPGDGKALARLTRELSRVLSEVERARAAAVIERIDRRIMEQLRPKDLLYQILDGLRALTSYDHSSAVLLTVAGGAELELAGEQIAVGKHKSTRIGQRLRLDDTLRGVLRRQAILGFDRTEGGWLAWQGEASAAVPAALSWECPGDATERSMIVAPLGTGEQAFGLLKVASCHPRHLGAFEADLVRELLPRVAAAIRNAETTRVLQDSVSRAERRHAMVNIARGVSHDVNNALGTALPTVQQILAELEDDLAGRGVEPERLRRDLTHIEAALRTCRRIFGGLLTMARGEARSVGQGSLGQAVRNALAVVHDGMERRGIRIEIDLAPNLPPVRAVQHELEQLLLNLASNARDAMAHGGSLTIKAKLQSTHVEVVVADTGMGMSPEQLAHAEVPFYTTKEGGNGLGLSICRSIVADMRGQMEIDSKVDAGTTVRLRLPVAGSTGAEELAGSLGS